MYDFPTEDQLPDRASLHRSSAAAVLVGLLLLLTVVLPAEYAIDPTGLGRQFGLTQMGALKVALAAEAAESKAEPAAPPVAAQQPAPSQQAVPHQQHNVRLRLQPGTGTEVKLEMPEGAKVRYQWSASGSGLYYDTHGDPYNAPKDFYHGYGKGRDASEQSGELVAAFDGRHGWYWRNNSEQEVELVLRTEGEYITIEQFF